jgi:hypothetical protein
VTCDAYLPVSGNQKIHALNITVTDGNIILDDENMNKTNSVNSISAQKKQALYLKAPTRLLPFPSSPNKCKYSTLFAQSKHMSNLPSKGVLACVYIEANKQRRPLIHSGTRQVTGEECIQTAAFAQFVHESDGWGYDAHSCSAVE